MKKVVVGESFSNSQYMKVIGIYPKYVELLTAQGTVTRIDKAILNEDSYSAAHFDHEVKCNMKELSEILQEAKDTIFTVQFKRKL